MSVQTDKERRNRRRRENYQKKKLAEKQAQEQAAKALQPSQKSDVLPAATASSAVTMDTDRKRATAGGAASDKAAKGTKVRMPFCLCVTNDLIANVE
jgi:hypothetical protein